ncbi:MAG: DUF3047 domain-containing protein [Gammaproteobacteria bacterium]|nr:DUF3047 domain-containing protein [Gammaproteobacteria bacterium]
MLRTITWMPLVLLAFQLHAEPVVVDEHSVEHIHFKRIKPNIVSFDNRVIRFSVNNSASFLLLAFDDIKNVNSVSFQWKAAGNLKKNGEQHERSRKGDDAWLRIGLILEGEPAHVPEPLLPRWMQQVRKTLKYPSNRMVYLVPGALHAPGTSWPSPFSDDVDMVSVSSSAASNGWKQVAHQFAESQRTVGLWIMADGDNTNSVFSSELRHLVID